MSDSSTVLGLLAQVREAINQDVAFRRLGTSDFTVIFAVGSERVKVIFEAFEVAEVSDASHLQDRDADFVLTFPVQTWSSYLRRRASGAGESLLALDLDHGIVKARDPIARLGFERFNRSLQAFVDAGAKLAA